MKIKVAKKKCFTATDMRTFQRLANYVTSHYPKDSALHKNVRSCFQSFGAAASKLSQAKPKVARRKTRRAPAKRRMRRGVKRARTAPKRRTSMKRKGTKRTTRRAPRRLAARRSTRRPMRRRRAA